MSDAVTVKIDASPERIYALVADVTRMGEWSPECYACEWVGDATAAAVGAEFLGRNRMAFFKWTTTCVVESAVPGQEFSFVAGDEKEGKTRWAYRFEPNGSGTKVTESWETLVPPPLRIAVAERVMLLGRTRESNLRKAMLRTLGRIKVAAESGG